jgi:hypothetical protein
LIRRRMLYNARSLNTRDRHPSRSGEGQHHWPGRLETSFKVMVASSC